MKIKKHLGFEHRMTAKGKLVRFSDNRLYQPMLNGELRRVSPLKPWANKAGHKQHLKARRLERMSVS